MSEPSYDYPATRRGLVGVFDFVAKTIEREPPFNDDALVAARYDLKLWIGHSHEGAAYLPC